MNFGAFDALVFGASPICGLRPERAARFTTENLEAGDSDVASLRQRLPTTAVSPSTARAVSARLAPDSLERAAINSVCSLSAIVPRRLGNRVVVIPSELPSSWPRDYPTGNVNGDGGGDRLQQTVRILTAMLRALIAVYALAALWFAAIWVSGVVDLFDPNFNEDKTLGDDFLIGQALVGFFGVLATLLASGAGLAFARSAARRWLPWVGLSTVCALPLFVFWLFVLAGPAGSS